MMELIMEFQQTYWKMKIGTVIIHDGIISKNTISILAAWDIKRFSFIIFLIFQKMEWQNNPHQRRHQVNAQILTHLLILMEENIAAKQIMI